MKQTFKRVIVSLSLFTASLVFFLCATVAAIASAAILANPDSWYFPGDPPWAELGLQAAGAASLSLLAAAAALVTTGRQRHRLVRFVGAGCVVLLAIIAAMPAAVIAGRHFGQWAALRAIALEEVGGAEAAGDARSIHGEDRIFRFKGRALPVRILGVAAGSRPSVHIDFGDGTNATLDLRTMWCIHSD